MTFFGVRQGTSVIVACAVLTLGTAAAQEFRGTILGRVTDPQGGAIPHVTIVVTGEETNVSSEALTEADGAYAVPFLIPGKYRVEVTLPGFKKFVQSGITVGITQHATVDIKLQLGEVTETVDVRAEASLLDRASGSLGQTIDVKKVEDMPLNGRMIFMLNRTAAGVNWNGSVGGATGTSGLRPFDNSGGSDWSMNGGRAKTNEFLLDGAPNSTRGQYNFAPPVDAVEEFKIQTNTYDAQYGRTGGGVVNMTLKSGSNDFHGQAWDFLKNEKLNANPALNVETKQPKPPYEANQYGVTIRGPVLKNRTFFMGTFEGLRERVPFPTTTSVPTAAERRGDFSQSYTDQTTPLIIYDPLTTVCDASGRCTRAAFANNIIPPDRINPVAQRILNIFPLPNIAGQRLRNYLNPINNGRYDYDSELARIDHKISDASKLFVSLHHNHRDEFRSNNGLQGTFANQGQWPQTRINRGGTVDWVKSIGDRSLLNVRSGLTWFTEEAQQSDVKGFDRNTLGFQNLPGQYLPVIAIQDHADMGVGSDGRGVSDRTTSIQGNYTRTFARQTMKLGSEYRYIQAQPVSTGNYNGSFGFTRGFTQRDPNNGDSVSGNSVASFLLGYPAGNNGGSINTNFGGGSARLEHWHYTALYFQDDFRVSPKLTVNAGVRWDYETAPVENLNRLVRGFAYDQTNPLASQTANAPGANACPACANLKGGLLFAGVNGVPRGLFDQQRNNFQPRAGFAYSLNEKMVVRGGYGLYYSYRSQTGPQDGFFVTTPYFVNDINGRVGIPELTLNTFANPFPNGALQPPGSSQGLATLVGRGISFDDPTNKMPHIHQYNITVSREISRDLFVEASYVGSQTRDISVTNGININVISADDLARGAANPAYLQQAVTNPFAGLLPGTSMNGATIQRQNLLVPYPEFGGITKNAYSIGKGWYNSLQLVVQKRYSNGLSFLSSYVFSKTKEQVEFLNAQDPAPVKETAGYDRPHIWNFSGAYELPVGRNRTFGKNMGTLMNQIVGGWQVNWNFNWQSGKPLGTPGLEPIRGTSAVLSHPTADRWFNTCYLDLNGNMKSCLPDDTPVWRQRPQFTLRTTPHRLDDIREPWKPTLDASLFKHFELPHRTRFELRIEAFNLTNTVIWPSPSTNFQNANFGRIATPRGSAYVPRNIQIGMKLLF